MGLVGCTSHIFLYCKVLPLSLYVLAYTLFLWKGAGGIALTSGIYDPWHIAKSAPRTWGTPLMQDAERTSDTSKETATAGYPLGRIASLTSFPLPKEGDFWLVPLASFVIWCKGSQGSKGTKGSKDSLNEMITLAFISPLEEPKQPENLKLSNLLLLAGYMVHDTWQS